MMTTQAEGELFEWFLGIDWATSAHQICLLDAAGTVVSEEGVAHTAAALATFIDALEARAGGTLARVAVAIEVPRGAVVETLLERGAAVFTLNPKQVDRFRDRFTVAGAKDDRRDAWVQASALRTDRAAFRQLSVDDPRVIQLREVARADEDLAHESTRLTNRLREQIYRITPHWLALCPGATEPWFWALLEHTLLRTGRRAVKRSTIERLLREHRIRRHTADDVVAVLEAPPLHVAPGTREAAMRHIALLLPRLRLVSEQRRACARTLEALLTELAGDDPPAGGATGDTPGASDVAITRSLPGVGRMVAATLFAEAGALIRLRHYTALRALGGLAPVTRQSGRARTVSMRYACNARLRDAFYHWARTATVFDPGAKSYYAALRARGHSHGRALRSVADRALRTLMAMLRNRTLYDPSHRGAGLQPVAT